MRWGDRWWHLSDIIIEDIIEAGRSKIIAFAVVFPDGRFLESSIIGTNKIASGLYSPGNQGCFWTFSCNCICPNCLWGIGIRQDKWSVFLVMEGTLWDWGTGIPGKYYGEQFAAESVEYSSYFLSWYRDFHCRGWQAENWKPAWITVESVVVPSAIERLVSCRLAVAEGWAWRYAIHNSLGCMPSVCWEIGCVASFGTLKAKAAPLKTDISFTRIGDLWWSSKTSQFLWRFEKPVPCLLSAGRLLSGAYFIVFADGWSDSS